MVNDLISVVTITRNNYVGLKNTLDSLCACQCKPAQIIIIDGKSNDGTTDLVHSYMDKLSITIVSESDKGIYDAMNKGLAIVKTSLVHYLNSGDLASGDIYLNCNEPGLFPVKIFDPIRGNYWFDIVKMAGYGYCHQGIVFPSNHSPFSENFIISADFEVVCKTFCNGLTNLKTYTDGHVIYELGGISSVKSNIGNREIIKIAYKLLKKQIFFQILFFILFKNVLPRFLRRFLVIYIINRNNYL